MRDLWRKTSALFWDNPILWLPVVCADLLAFCFTRLQRLLTRQLVNSFLLSHSALTGQAIPPVNEHAVITKAWILTMPFFWGTNFLNTCLYTAAFVVIATLVRGLRRLKPDPPRLLGALGSHIERILVFSLKLLALYALAVALVVPTTTFAQKWKIPTTDFAPGFLILAALLIPYCMVPAGISLVRDGRSRIVPAEYVKWGRGFSILMVLASFATGYFAQVVEQSLMASPHLVGGLTRLLIEALGSSAAAFPYVLLFIFLSLIATNDPEDPEFAGPGCAVAAQPE